MNEATDALPSESYQRGSLGSPSLTPTAGPEEGSNATGGHRMMPLSLDPNSRPNSFAEHGGSQDSSADWVESIAMPQLDLDEEPKLSHDRLRLLFGLMGTGTLFPYNTIITCVDYFAALHPDVSDVAGQLAASCISALLVTTLVLLPLSTPPAKPNGENRDGFTHAAKISGRCSRSLGSVFASATKRIMLGYVLCFVCLLLMAALRSPSMLTLNVASFVVGIADATSQSGLYVFAASYHQPSYSAAITFGSAIAGLAVGVMRLSTRGLFDTSTVGGLRTGVTLLFVLSAGVIAACIWALLVVLRDGSHGGWDGRDVTDAEAVQNGNAHTNETGSDVVSTDGKECGGGAVDAATPPPQHTKRCHRLLHHPRLEIFLQTIRITWKPTFSAFLNFFITLSLFPGTVSSIQSLPDNGAGLAVRFGDWLPIVLITTFNAADCAGRGVLNVERLGIARLLLSRRHAVRSDGDRGGDRALLPNLNVLVWYHSLARIVFYPLLAICVLPVAPHPIVTSDLLRCAIVFVFGFSNGFVNCAAFMASPSIVCDERRRDAASLLLLLSIYFGLTGGAYFGLMVDSILRSLGNE